MYNGKMLRSNKQFGRCNVEEHGQDLHCEVYDEIQDTPITRAQDKRKWKKEINQQLLEMECQMISKSYLIDQIRKEIKRVDNEFYKIFSKSPKLTLYISVDLFYDLCSQYDYPNTQVITNQIDATFEGIPVYKVNSLNHGWKITINPDNF